MPKLAPEVGLAEAVETLKMDVNINYSMNIITANAGSLPLPGFTLRGSGV